MRKLRWAGLLSSMVLAALLGLTMLHPTVAYADELDDLQARVEETSQAYEEAQARLEELEKAVEEKQAEIDEIEELLPIQRQDAALAIRDHYKMQKSSPSLVDFILSAEDFNQFLTLVTYLDAIQASKVDAVDLLIATEAELDMQKLELAQRKEVAEQEAKEAQAALEEAQAAREEAQRRAEEEAARQAAEAAAALEAARAAAAAQQTLTTTSGNTTEVSVPQETSSSENETVDWGASDRDSFIAQWGARIDAYLAGSPLAGHGSTFAAAAWDYGVDPRWSPAISCTESSKGAHCFLPYNAWGWGNASWGSWDEAIYAHVAGLAAGYGYTISPAAAQRYCPPNWELWYANTLAQMQMI